MKKNQMKFVLFGILCTLVTTGINAQNTEKNKKINEQISKISKEKKANKQLIHNGLEQIGSETSKSQESLTKNWITKGNAVQIIANCSDDVNGLIQELTLLGTSNIKTYGKTVTGYIPMDSVSKLENCKHLRSVVPSLKPKLNSGGVNSEGDRAMFSENLRKRYNVDGTGIKIGILSDSYNTQGLAESEVLKGELPGPGNPFGYTKPVQVLSEIKNLSNASDEGRAMAQIVHDVAPGAELFFYSAFNGYFDFANGIKALAAKACNVIVDDISYFEDPYFQDGLVSQASDEVTQKGVLYFAAAGNNSNKSFEAKYKETSLIDDSGKTLNYFDFGDQDITQTITIPSGTTVDLWLQWDAPSRLAGSSNPAPKSDLNFYLIDSNTKEIVAKSITNNIQSLTNFERITYINNEFSDQDIDLVIQRVGETEAPTRVKYVDFNFNTELIFTEDVSGINASTCVGHNNGKKTIAIGANVPR
jgi:hypothetical protein